MRFPLAMIAWDDLWITMLASRMPRPEWEPPPNLTMSVSPVTSRTRSNGTPSHSVSELGEARLVPLAVGDRADHDVDEAVRRAR